MQPWMHLKRCVQTPWIRAPRLRGRTAGCGGCHGCRCSSPSIRFPWVRPGCQASRGEPADAVRLRRRGRGKFGHPLPAAEHGALGRRGESLRPPSARIFTAAVARRATSKIRGKDRCRPPLPLGRGAGKHLKRRSVQARPAFNFCATSVAVRIAEGRWTRCHPWPGQLGSLN